MITPTTNRNLIGEGLYCIGCSKVFVASVQVQRCFASPPAWLDPSSKTATAGPRHEDDDVVDRLPNEAFAPLDIIPPPNGTHRPSPLKENHLLRSRNTNDASQTDKTVSGYSLAGANARERCLKHNPPAGFFTPLALLKPYKKNHTPRINLLFLWNFLMLTPFFIWNAYSILDRFLVLLHLHRRKKLLQHLDTKATRPQIPCSVYLPYFCKEFWNFTNDGILEKELLAFSVSEFFGMTVV